MRQSSDISMPYLTASAEEEGKMQGGRSNTGGKTTPMSGRNATRMSNVPTPQPEPFKPAQFGKPGTPAPINVPSPSSARPQAATPNVPRSGSREIARVDSAGLAAAGQQTGTPPQPAQERLPTAPNSAR